MRGKGVLFFVALCLSLLLEGVHSVELENTSVQRSIDLTSQVYRETVLLSITNTGSETATTYDFVLEHAEHIAFFEPKVKKSEERLQFTITQKGEHKIAAIVFNPPLKPTDKAILSVTIVKTHVFQPYPKEIGQNEKQQILYVGNILYPSVYPTLKTKTSFSTPNEEVTSSNSELSISANKLTFGPANDKVIPHSYKEARIHFTNNARFLVTEKLVRTLEVSHWGNNLAYEEFYDTIHGGATLKGHYSRLEYDREAYRHHDTAVIKQVDFELPPDATDVYYRDIIGNISTSNFRSSPFETSSSLELRPRFPLFGGWKTSWYHGYNTLLSNSLQVGSDGAYILNFPFVNPYEDAVIDEFILRVTLPEGATGIQFHSEFDLDIEQTTEKVATYLDTIGRPVVVIKKKNVVGEHKVPVQITYRYGTTLMLQEPLLLMGFYFTLFVLSMLFIRLDLSISNPEREKIEKIRAHWFDLIEKEDQKKVIFEELKSSKVPFEKRKGELQEKLNKLDADVVREIKPKLEKIDASLGGKIEQLNNIGQNRFKKICGALSAVDADPKKKEAKLSEIKLTEDDAAVEKILSEYS